MSIKVVHSLDEAENICVGKVVCFSLYLVIGYKETNVVLIPILFSFTPIKVDNLEGK